MLGPHIVKEAAGRRAGASPVADVLAETYSDTLAEFRRVEPGVEAARKIDLDRSKRVQTLFDEEPARVDPADFRMLLLSSVMSGASDVTIQTGRQVRAEIQGHLYLLTRRPLGDAEVNEILVESYGGPAAGSHARTEINGQKVLDYSYEIGLLDGRRQRFRCNATGIHAPGGGGVELTFRALPQKTPNTGDVGIGGPMLASMMPREGLVVVAGATGHGKSTTLAAVVRLLLEEADRPSKIVDIQAPIEFTFEDVWGDSSLPRSSSTIGQSEVGRHIRSFAEGVRSALRRKPHVIVVGEARDYETIGASLEAAITGHLVYTTTHAGSVPDVIRRLLAVFPGEERDARSYDLISALRMMMVQVLVPKIGGGRVPVREFLVVTEDLRERLLTEPPSSWAGIVTKEMARPADESVRESLINHANRLHADGLIVEEDRRRMTRGAFG